jgi:hypothetical protein
VLGVCFVFPDVPRYPRFKPPGYPSECPLNFKPGLADDFIEFLLMACKWFISHRFVHNTVF